MLILSEIKNGKGELRKSEIRNREELPPGIWCETSDGRRVPGINELVDLRFPPEAVMNILAGCGDDTANGTPLCQEDRREIEFADGKFVLSRYIDGLFER